MGKAVDQWNRALAKWAIPKEILAAAPQDPHDYPKELLVRRTEDALRRKKSFSARKALEVMPIAGRVMDIGVGAGSGSLPLTPQAFLIVGVDPKPEMMAEFERIASIRGVQAKHIHGKWPDVIDKCTHADVVISHHLLWHIPDIGPFVNGMANRALLRVVIEITEEHPLAWMSDLWDRFHDLKRPMGPYAEDAFDAIRELGWDAHAHEELVEPILAGFEEREEAIALVRRRLCLPADKDPEVAEALGERLAYRDGLWTTLPEKHTVVTIWWDPRTR
jgi:SAM-dependent methyltransferase